MLRVPRGERQVPLGSWTPVEKTAVGHWGSTVGIRLIAPVTSDSAIHQSRELGSVRRNGVTGSGTQDVSMAGSLTTLVYGGSLGCCTLHVPLPLCYTCEQRVPGVLHAPLHLCYTCVTLAFHLRYTCVTQTRTAKPKRGNISTHRWYAAPSPRYVFRYAFHGLHPAAHTAQSTAGGGARAFTRPDGRPRRIGRLTGAAGVLRFHHASSARPQVAESSEQTQDRLACDLVTQGCDPSANNRGGGVVLGIHSLRPREQSAAPVSALHSEDTPMFSLPFCDWCPLQVYSFSPSAIGARYGYILVRCAGGGEARWKRDVPIESNARVLDGHQALLEAMAGLLQARHVRKARPFQRGVKLTRTRGERTHHSCSAPDRGIDIHRMYSASPRGSMCLSCTLHDVLAGAFLLTSTVYESSALPGLRVYGLTGLRVECSFGATDYGATG
eukprot:1176754-Prorocentrum_minimum.AAC.5